MLSIHSISLSDRGDREKVKTDLGLIVFFNFSNELKDSNAID
jgi:hypothetical protein